MSENEEPPAKVLKIDNIDGVTRVTELQLDGGVPDVATLLDTGGEMQEEVHEEWLSEGLLTDDDLNPASQEDGDRTDSQLGTSQDEDQGEEEHLDSSMESDLNIPNDSKTDDHNSLNTQNEPTENMTEKTMEMGDNSNETAIADNETAIADNETATVDNETAFADNETATVDNETAFADNETAIADNETAIDDNEMAIDETVHNEQATSKSVKNELNNLDDKAESSSVCITAVIGCKSIASPISNRQGNMNVKVEEIETKTVEQNIEETMKHLDGKDGDVKSGELQEFLKEKSETKVNVKNIKAEVKKEGDGNDTDDLLRMLEEDDSKTKKLTKTVKDLRRAKPGDASSDDDDFVYEGAATKKLKAAKSVIAKKQPAKAVPEDMDDGDDEGDQSPDEMATLKKMFQMKNLTVKTKPKPPPKVNPSVKLTPNNNIVQMGQRSAISFLKPPLKQYQNKSKLQPQVKSILKTPAPKPTNKQGSTVQAPVKETEKPKIVFKPEVSTPAPFKSSMKSYARKNGDDDDIMDDEDFLDDDAFDMDEDFLESDTEVSSRQRVMRPETMDEEVPSDEDSRSEPGSLYDEIPSSDSEDVDDWFQFDIRAEKAGDYIPLLGAKAKELLLEEKRRVNSRLQTLKQSLSALTESGKQQAEQLREATMSLANLDDLLKAS